MERPKRPMSSYMLWMNSAREKIKSENPGMKVTDIAKKAGEIWRNMDNKSEWIEKAVKVKEQYFKDLELYISNRGGGEVGKTYKRKQYGKKYVATKKIRPTSEDDDTEEDEDSYTSESD